MRPFLKVMGDVQSMEKVTTNFREPNLNIVDIYDQCLFSNVSNVFHIRKQTAKKIN